VSAPLIAIPAYRLSSGRVTKWSQGAFAIPELYAEAVARAGGQPALLPSPSVASPDEILERFDGLLLIGGGDVDPMRYGADAHARLYGVNRDRDQIEIDLARAAAKAAFPTLAICRGPQVANVAFGGTLRQHIPDEGLTGHGVPQEDDGYVPHDVRIEPGSKLSTAAGGEHITGSSSHHQAIDRLADGLDAVAWSEDGVIEGFERSDGWFVAVQWHPEVTAGTDPAQQSLFDAFIAQASSPSP
jgi:putative glutamine amidotransferase